LQRAVLEVVLHDGLRGRRCGTQQDEGTGQAGGEHERAVGEDPAPKVKCRECFVKKNHCVAPLPRWFWFPKSGRDELTPPSNA
jgi:hypothetical protein